MDLSNGVKFALAIVALIVAGIDQFMARGRSLTAWGVIALAVALMSEWWQD